ncbi:hypothetical protein [Kitasatospora sp. NPDC056531]|uniref:hypothetical protein n=1 Tax=Kitasatospora sp. NPDC056531 TaxID=3345856 RepID=UPI0036BAF3AD
MTANRFDRIQQVFGCADAADRIAARRGVTATESAVVTAGHVTVTPGALVRRRRRRRAWHPPPPPVTGDPAADPAMRGPEVEARSDGVIPYAF